MERHIFYSVEDFNDFYCQHKADTRAHWYLGPIETKCVDGTWTLREVKADLMAMDEDDLVGDDRYIEVWDVDDGEIDTVAVFKDGTIYAPEKVNVEAEKAIADKYEGFGFKRATEGAFVDEIIDFNPADGEVYFAFISAETFDWLDTHYGVTMGPVPEEDYPF